MTEDLSELKNIHDIAKAAEAYARAHGLIEKVNESYTAKEAALEDAQDMADVLLEAEAKLGKMLAEIEPKRKKESSTQRTSLPYLPDGITKKESHRAQTYTTGQGS